MGTFAPVLHGTSRLCIVMFMPTGTDPQPGDFSEALMQVVRARMAYLNFNITELSEKTGIPRATLSRIVNNKRVAHLENLREIALAIEMPMAQLFTAAERNLEGKDPFSASDRHTEEGLNHFIKERRRRKNEDDPEV